jgi:hypothetical protein
LVESAEAAAASLGARPAVPERKMGKVAPIALLCVELSQLLLDGR